MTRGLVRYQKEDDLHFVTFSCHKREPYLDSSEARDCFLQALERMRLKSAIPVAGYVVMPEHVHLLLAEPPEGLLGNVLQRLKLSVAKTLPESPFWTARYYDFNVFTRDKVVEKLKYMHRNPVKRGLCVSPEEWRWSSYRNYLLDEPGLVTIDQSYVTGVQAAAVPTLTAKNAVKVGAPLSVPPRTESLTDPEHGCPTFAQLRWDPQFPVEPIEKRVVVNERLRLPP